MLLAGKRIYMVEDNRDNVIVVQAILEQHGATVIVDWWATGAIHRMLAAMPLHLIILDLGLVNGRSGFEVFDDIRCVPVFGAVPVVAVTAADASTALPQAVAKGFTGYISKPIDFDLFPQQIASAITGKQIWHSH